MIDPNMPPELAEMVAPIDQAIADFEAQHVPPELLQGTSGPSLGLLNKHADAIAGYVTPIEDLRERLALLKDACVESYEDGPLRIRLNPEARLKTAGIHLPDMTR